MIPDWEPAREPQALRAWRELLRPIAVELRSQSPRLAQRTRERMQVIAPDVFDEPTSVEQVSLNVEAGLNVVAGALERGADATGAALPEGLMEGATLRAERGYPLSPLMRAFRIGHAILTEWMVSEIFARTSDRELQKTAISAGSVWVFGIVDALASAYAQAYETARDAWLRSAAAVRSETLNAVLSGTERDVGQASARLGYELDRHHVGIVGWIRPGEEGAGGQELLRAAMSEVIAAAGAESSLLEPLGLAAARGWMGRRTEFDLSALDLRSPVVGGPAVGLAIGEPGAGVDGFCRTYFEAEHARRIANLGRGRAGSVTRYGDVELLAIATIDMERTRVFVGRVLRDLAQDDDVSRRLASTLNIYLQENRSRTRAAKRLGIHENTVTYRIRQAEGILGGPVNDEMLDLSVALALLPLMR
jgi:hypothetical protein